MHKFTVRHSSCDYFSCSIQERNEKSDPPPKKKIDTHNDLERKEELIVRERLHRLHSPLFRNIDVASFRLIVCCCFPLLTIGWSYSTGEGVYTTIDIKTYIEFQSNVVVNPVSFRGYILYTICPLFNAGSAVVFKCNQVKVMPRHWRQ